MVGASASERIVGALRSFPSAIAVHGIEAAGHAGNGALPPEARQFLFELRRIAERRTRRRVAPIEKGVHGDRHPGGNRRIDQREEVFHRTVNASVGEQPHEVERSARARDVRDARLQDVVARELAAGNGVVDEHLALRHDASAAEVRVSHLGVAHDAFRQTHGFSRCLQRRPRIAREEGVPVRQIGGRNRVPVPFVAASPAVEDGNDDGTEPHRAALPMSIAKPVGSSDAPPTRPPFTLPLRT